MNTKARSIAVPAFADDNRKITAPSTNVTDMVDVPMKWMGQVTSSGEIATLYGQASVSLSKKSN